MGKKSSDAETVVIDKPRIVAGAMTAVGRARFNPGANERNATSDFLARCQVDATERCLALGITDPDEIKAKKREALRIGKLSLQGAIDKHIAELAEAAAKLGNTPADVKRAAEMLAGKV